jgi:hypothetical protein
MTFGFGFPVNTGPKSISHINVGIRAGRVGSTGLNPMQENYISYQIGIMLRPTSLTDRWFNKYKYN